MNLSFSFLQPQNLVMMGSFPESEVKLCDFEISRVILEGTEVREILGTPDYVGKSEDIQSYVLTRWQMSIDKIFFQLPKFFTTNRSP